MTWKVVVSLFFCVCAAHAQVRSYPYPAIATIVGNDFQQRDPEPPRWPNYNRPTYDDEPRPPPPPPPAPSSLGQMKWTHRIKLPSDMEVRWTASDPEYLIMEMHAPTNGWLAVGFSPTGSMAGADIFLGWVDSSGMPHLLDMHATRNTRPVLDTVQDLELIGGQEDGSGTTIRFRRRWDTCDEAHDSVIGDDTVRLIWALNEDDPARMDDGSHKPAYHGQDSLLRGVRSVYMKDRPKHRKFPDEEDVYPSDVVQVDLKVSNIDVPKTETYYYCKILKIPKLERKHHVIAFKPLIEPASVPYVHHMLVYKCEIPEVVGKRAEDVFEKFLDDPATDCYGKDSPQEWNQFCFQFWITVAVGSEGDILPDHLGDVIGSTEGPSYYRLEVHYENPGGAQLVDSSGFRIFYTPTLRPFETSTFFVGHRHTPFLTVPPGQKEYTVWGFCPTECTQNNLPTGGIKIFSLLLHAHLSGTKITLRHIRNGKELPIIAQDLHYDFNYQQFRMLNKEVTILPGDQLVTECTYTSAGNDTFIYGGLSTRQEMCLVIIHYYPKATLIDCRSQEEFYSYFNAIGVDDASGPMLNTLNLPFDPEKVPKELRKFASFDDTMLLGSSRAEKIDHELFKGVKITKPDTLSGTDMHDYMIHLPWQDKSFTKSVERKRKMGSHYMHCTLQGGAKFKTSADALPFPRYEPYQAPPKQCRRGNPLLRGPPQSNRRQQQPYARNQRQPQRYQRYSGPRY